MVNYDLTNLPLSKTYHELVRILMINSEELSDGSYKDVNGELQDLSGNYQISGRSYKFHYHLSDNDLQINTMLVFVDVYLKMNDPFCPMPGLFARHYNPMFLNTPTLLKHIHRVFMDMYQMLKEKNLVSTEILTV